MALTNAINFRLSKLFALTGDISPAQITANQNDYNPTNLSTASVLRLNSDASRDITGLAGGEDGRIIIIHNVGIQNIVLKDESVSSTAANRFALNADLTLGPDQSCILWYDSTSSRWRLASSSVGSGGGGGGGGAWQLAASNTTISGVNAVNFTNLGAYSELMVFYRQVTFSVSDQVAVRVSNDNGSTFFSTSGDYVLLPSTGAESNNTGIFPQSAAATVARSGLTIISQFNLATYHLVVNPLRTDASGTPAEYISQTVALNAIRVYSFSANNFTGGAIYVFGR